MTTVTIPSLTQHAEVQTAREKLVRTQLETAAVQGEIDVLLGVQAEQAAERKDKTTVAAEAFLAGASIAAAPTSLTPRLNDLRRQMRILRRAEQLARVDVQKAEEAASRAICAEVRPEYERLVTDLGKALIEAAKAEEALDAFHDQLRQQGITHSGSLPAMQFMPLANPRDKQGRIAQWFAEACGRSIVSASIVPAALAEAWGTPRIWDRWRQSYNVPVKAPSAPGPVRKAVKRVTGWLNSETNADEDPELK